MKSISFSFFLLTSFLLLGHLPAQSQAVASSSDMQPNSGKGTSQDTTKGIHFVNGLSWQEVLQKAKATNKYIFVDCYASWCGPCKAMDNDIYPQDSVGQAMNDRFLSIKVQMDTSKNDDDRTKAWYADAHILMTTYKVSAFPSFLFFSPDGKIIHRGVGFKQTGSFVELVNAAYSPANQYYSQKEAFQSGVRNYSIMAELALSANTYHEKEFAMAVATAYLHGHLDNLSYSQINTEANITFLLTFPKALHSSDKAFEFFEKHGGLADSTMHNKDLSKRMVNYVITMDEIIPTIDLAKKGQKEPDWEQLGKRIGERYEPSYAEENIVNGKVAWYREQKDWKKYTKYLVRKIDLMGIANVSSGILLNNSAWDIFEHSSDIGELEKAVAWCDRAMELDVNPNAGNLDTKANLLYKLGKRDEAVALETRAVQLDPDYKELSEFLKKMKEGQPTWSNE